MKTNKVAVPAEVHKWLQANSRKGSKIGGQMTKKLIELGKKSAFRGTDVSEKEAA